MFTSPPRREEGDSHVVTSSDAWGDKARKWRVQVFSACDALAMSAALSQKKQAEGEECMRAAAKALKTSAMSFKFRPDWETACACLLYTSPSPRDATLSRMPSSA